MKENKKRLLKDLPFGNLDKDLEKTIKMMWEANVVSYPLGSTTDEAYKYGWEMGCRFRDAQLATELEAQKQEMVGMIEENTYSWIHKDGRTDIKEYLSTRFKNK